jgi:ribose 1,5-bisphosphokinase PhnN
VIRGAVIGPSLSGKSVLTQSLARDYFTRKGIRSLVLDPIARSPSWGSHCWVSYNEAEFWATVWKCRNCLVIVDDGSVTIKRDKELIPVFTALRHLHHRLLVVAHDSSDFVPVMRRQFDTLYLFKQDQDAAEAWAKVFMNDEIYQVTQLNQYEFLRCRAWKPVEKMRLTM